MFTFPVKLFRYGRTDTDGRQFGFIKYNTMELGLAPCMPGLSQLKGPLILAAWLTELEVTV